jgi:putative redox protein
METVKGSVNIKWAGARMMLGVDSRGAAIPIGYNRDADPTWNGVKPSDLLLLAAASCSAYDVIEILEKQRESVDELNVQCTGEQITEQPYKFVAVHLKYIIRGAVDPKKVERAIRLSEEKYCSVLATLRPSLTLSSEYEIIEIGEI